MEWEEILIKAVVALTGVIGTVYQFKNIRPKMRSKLKTDLEILSMLEKDDPNHKLVQEYVNESMKGLYSLAGSRKSDGSRITSWGDFIFGIIFTSLFTTATIYIVQDGWNWWALLTGFFVFAGIGGILNGFDKNK